MKYAITLVITGTAMIVINILNDVGILEKLINGFGSGLLLALGVYGLKKHKY